LALTHTPVLQVEAFLPLLDERSRRFVIADVRHARRGSA
jgi:hypothetical protein